MTIPRTLRPILVGAATIGAALALTAETTFPTFSLALITSVTFPK
jgi:hypothetical protein